MKYLVRFKEFLGTLKPTSRHKWSACLHGLISNFRQKIALQNARKLHALKKQCAVDSDQLSTDPMLRWVLNWCSISILIWESDLWRANQSVSTWNPIQETQQLNLFYIKMWNYISCSFEGILRFFEIIAETYSDIQWLTLMNLSFYDALIFKWNYYSSF